MKLTFYGGATHVTGANYLLEAGGIRILVDCGMIQGSRYNDEMNYRPFGYDPSSVDVLFVTHSHVDHMGRIPKLYRDGFRGAIYMTEPTAAVVAVALPDTLDRMAADAKEFGLEPLYDENDMKSAIGLFRGVPYRHDIALNDRIVVHARDSGHVLGSASWVFQIKDDDGADKRIVFSGDIGNSPSALVNDIDYPSGADYVLVESAYGGRIHEARDQRSGMLLETIRETVARSGVLMIPSFAVERTQELLLELDKFFDAGHFPRVPVFLDSPLAIAITKTYGEFSRYFNPRAREILRDNRGLFQFSWLTPTPKAQESKSINDVLPPKIIIAGGGMSQGGRILHHEARYLSNPESTILFIGYQVHGSLGRRIKDGEKNVKIFGAHIRVRCRIVSIDAYSAHADQNGLVEYVRRVAGGGQLKKCFIVQGELESAQALAAMVSADPGVETIIPELGQSFEL